MQPTTFEQDPYCTELDVTVVEAGDDNGTPWAVTDDTLFYPEGGGQPADRGHLGSARVVDVVRHRGRIVHRLDTPVTTGPIRLELDWQRRFDHMQQHTAQHLLTALALTRFGWRTTAFHLGPALSDIELDVAEIPPDERRRLEDVVNEAIRENLPVTVHHADPEQLTSGEIRSRGLPAGLEGPLRIVAIGGLDRNTCGGTHVRSTAEIGVLALLTTESLRGGTRLHFVAGDRVRRRLGAHEERSSRLRTVLGAPDDELAEVVELKLEQLKESGRAVRRLLDELAEVAARSLAEGAVWPAAAHFEERELGFLQSIGRRLVEIDPSAVALLTSGAGAEGVFAVVAGPRSAVADLKATGAEVATLLQGRGGGAPPIYQGKASRLDLRPAALAALALKTR